VVRCGEEISERREDRDEPPAYSCFRSGGERFSLIVEAPVGAVCDRGYNHATCRILEAKLVGDNARASINRLPGRLGVAASLDDLVEHIAILAPTIYGPDAEVP
jgi:hypothetical protein